MAGFLLLLTGIGLNFWLVQEWLSQGLGQLQVGHTMRYALWGLTATVLGVQTIFGSFFLSLLGLNRR